MTHWFGLRPDARRALAITACEDAVRHDLAAPSTARFDDTSAKADVLSEDDRVRLGFDAPRVSAIWAVYGTVASQDKSGQTASLEFACRAAFFDGQATRTSVDFGSADLPGQLALPVF
jgi:hypothetical protein